jgi:hypothetical protein
MRGVSTMLSTRRLWGPQGFAELLQTLQDATHLSHDEACAWLGDFVPEPFSADDINRRLPVTERSGKKKWIHFRWACPKFCGRAFTSGRGIPSLTRNGREATINNNGSEARGITRRCEVWPSNGFASFSVAGKIVSLMTRADIWPRSPNETHRSLRSLLGQSCEIFVDTL